MVLFVDNEEVAFNSGDTVLTALLKANIHPTGQGCLCAAGDCSSCLVSVDGVAYVRSCEAKARDGQQIQRAHAPGRRPPLLRPETNTPSQPAQTSLTAEHHSCDVVIIGGGSAGLEAANAARRMGQDAIVLDAQKGQEVLGIYPGPLVVARTESGTLQFRPRLEIVIATGAAEIQPVAEGSQLRGVMTRRAAQRLSNSGVDLGMVVALGSPPSGLAAREAHGELIRFSPKANETSEESSQGDQPFGARSRESRSPGAQGKLGALVFRDDTGQEQHWPCDTATVDLGLTPRDALLRMARGLNGNVAIRVVGDAALEADIPGCPKSGTVCPCSQVQVDDLQRVWDAGFQELELVKRATLAGTGTCQGSVCIPHLRSFLLARGKTLQPPFTARPATRQPTFSEIAAGAHHPPTARTALHGEHTQAGAKMERSGGWWRPWRYGTAPQRPDPAEYRAVRKAVSICDVSTLGKIVVSGPDCLAFLEFIYPTKVATIREGRSRYALLLNERGYVQDDGLIAREGDRFYLTLTSSGATFGELWLRDWAEAQGFDVRLMNQTMSLGAINVTGPRAAELLARASDDELPTFGAHLKLHVAGVPCHVFRLSFTGELSFELHHPAMDSAALWNALLTLGQDLGIRPHGLDTLMSLRLEKGHIVVGKDTDFDSTPRRIAHEWAVAKNKDAFVGRQSVQRTNKTPLDRQLIGLVMESPTPVEGSILWSLGEGGETEDRSYCGYVTSSTYSPTLSKVALLAWASQSTLDTDPSFQVDGRPALRATLPFLDPEGTRARRDVPETSEAGAPSAGVSRSRDDEPRTPAPAPKDEWNHLERLDATRVAARPEALDRCQWPDLVLRLAEDEALALGRVGQEKVDDEHAILLHDSGWAGVWLDTAEVLDRLVRTCRWTVPTDRPTLVQGAIAEIPVKIWLDLRKSLIVVPAPFAADFEQRFFQLDAPATGEPEEAEPA